MGNWYAKSESGKSLMVFEENDESREFDTVTLSMLINNNISCLIPCSFSQIDETRYIKFNVTSKIEFREFLERQTYFDIVSDLFINMCRSFIELQKYMINTEALYLDTDWMYIDMSTRTAQFLIAPLLEEQRYADPKRFFQDIVIQLKMSEADSQYIGAILTLLNDKSFTIDGFIEGLEKLKSSKGVAAVAKSPEIPNRQEAYTPQQMPKKTIEPILTPVPKTDPYDNEEWSVKSKPEKIQAHKESFDPGGIKDIFAGIGKRFIGLDKSSKPQKQTKKSSALGSFAIPGQKEDIVGNMGTFNSEQHNPAEEPLNNVPKAPKPLHVAQQERQSEAYVAPLSKDSSKDDTTEMMGAFSDDGTPRLIRAKTNEVIEIDKDTFNLGKDPKELLDYVINDQRVSRRHASILCKNGSYYIIDRGSTNHTFLNGRMLVANQEYEISKGDVLRLGPEEFMFEI